MWGGFRKGSMRNDTLAMGEAYHVYTKSIAGFRIFNTQAEFERMRLLLGLYQAAELPMRLSWLIKAGSHRVEEALAECRNKPKRIQLIAYTIMPTHLHLFIKQIERDGISEYLRCVLNGYTRYFNIKLKRKGPLYESRFQKRNVKTTEDALHVTRYIHLNPVTAGLVDKIDDWEFSSYAEYMDNTRHGKGLCDFEGIVSLRSAVTSSSQRGELLPLRSPKGDALKALF